MTQAPSKPPSASWLRLVPAAILPGLGPLLRRQWSLAAMMMFASFWVRLALAGHTAQPEDRLDAFVLGAFGFAGGLARPTAVFLTVVALAVHGLAAWAESRAFEATKKGAVSV